MPAKTYLSTKKREMDLLTSAFENFTQATETLKKSYKALQQKIARLNSELSETNKALSRKVTELNKVRTYLNNILDSMMDGLVAIDSEGKITILNRAAERITGYRAKKILGLSYEVAFGKENEDFVSILRKTFREKRPMVGEKPFFSQNKSIFLEVITNPIAGPENKMEGVVVVFRDISMLKHLKEEIRRKEKLAILGEMAASIAHEIRNPLSGIEGFALLLKESLKEDEERKNWIDNIVKGARSLNNLVTSLLNFSRCPRVNLQYVVIDKLIESILSFIQQKIQKEKRNIHIVKEFPPQPVEMIADPDMLKQAFLNLAINAIEAMPGGGKLRISIKKKNYPEYEPHQFVREIDGDYTLTTSCGEVCVEFSDTGCGISPEEKKKIFRPFYTTKSKGCGLGLAIVQQIIHSHWGDIKVKSKPGQGTTFVLTLPLINDLREIKNGCREYSHSR